MFKRVYIVALAVAAFLVLAVPALAFNGYREDYTQTVACATCHTDGSFAPGVYDQWVETKHAAGGTQANRLPYGSSCGGCHTSNYDPSKVVPTPTATSTSGAVSWGAANGYPTENQAVGSAASSEGFIGCSSCHYGANMGPGFAEYGVDENNTAHRVPMGEMANADICGQCHSRYSYTVDTYPVASVPYVAVDASGSPIPNPSPTTLLQPQYAIGFAMLGAPSPAPDTGWEPAAPLSSNLNYPMSGWTPTPDPSATAASGLMTYWKDAEGNDTLWQRNGHDGSAAQYPEWANEGHARSLETLKALMGPNPPATCLGCHSADYRIAEEGEKPTGAEAKYGITCVGCHTPHDAGTTKGKWDEEFDAQLIGDPKNSSDLCITCHNGHLAEGQEATPGTEIHHPMKEMMAGYGAIGVDEIPSVHEGKCVQCHMPPTSYSRGSAQLGGNHTFTIIEPEVAAEVSNPSTDGPSGAAGDVMPYSACSTCHGGQAPNDPLATYLQGTIEQRQSWTKAKIEAIWDELDAAAVTLGYADVDAAHTALVAIPESQWNALQKAFLSSYTNVEFVESEGSFGIHNFAYSVRIVNRAMQQAKAVTAAEPRKYIASIKASKNKVKRNQKVRYSGAVQSGFGFAAQGKVTLMKKKKGGSWSTWKTQMLTSSGTYSWTLKMTKKGTWYVKVMMPGDGGLNLTGYSRYVKVVVK